MPRVELGTWAAKSAHQRGLANFHQGLLTDQHFPEDSFDVVAAIAVLEHLAAPREDLQEIYRVLRPGGIFYADVPNYRCLSIVLGRDDFELNLPPQHVNYFTPTTLRRLLNSAGFEVFYLVTSGGLKWENLLGRPIKSAEAEVYRGPASPVASSQAPMTNDLPLDDRADQRPQAPLLKRLLRPLVQTFFYRMAKVGMNLKVFARKQVSGRAAR